MSGLRQIKQKARAGTVALWVAIGAGIFALLLTGMVFSRDVVRDLASLKSATSDNVQWTLTQVEVEYLHFLLAVEEVEQGEDAQSALLAELRRSFDVFYSRVGILQNAALFEELRQTPGFEGPLQQIVGFLEAEVARFDSPDAVLFDEIGALEAAALALNGDVRNLSVAGLAYFARQSDARRNGLSNTLTHLAILSALLLVVLMALSFFLYAVNRKTRLWGRELSQANKRMHTILSTSLDGVVVSDMHGRVLEFNAAAEQIFQRSFDEVKGQKIGDIIVPPAYRDLHEAGMARMRAEGTRNVVGKGRVQLEGVRAGGEVFPVELALQSAFDGNQEIFIAFLRDISQQVADDKELIEARDRALAGEKAKAEFLTVMSHEIRTPLNGILGNLSLLEGSQLDPAQATYLRNMAISGRILMQHVNAVLDIESFEAGKLQIAREPVHLGHLLQDLVDAQGGNAASRGDVIEWQWVGPAHPWVQADAQRLQQVLLNLVGNAIKFTEAGRISIEAELQPVGDGVEGKRIVEFRVIDTGIGVAEQDLDRIFDDFQTSDASFRRVTGGTGLGLGIARRLVEAMGGDIGVESTLGEGSLFWVRLPMALISAPDKARADAASDGAERALDVLVVEDNEINLQVIRAMLEREGHRPVCVNDGRSGVSMAEMRRFDVILMDISMPVMDGLTATRQIRAGAGASAGIPIFAVSANVLPQETERFATAGMSGFLGKPVNRDELRDLLAAVAAGKIDVTMGARAPSVAAMVVDGAQIDEMRENLGAEAVAKLLHRFVDETDAFMAAWQGFEFGGTVPEGLIEASHKAAGSAAVFGAVAVRATLLSIEQACKAELPETLGDLVARLGAEWAESREVLSSNLQVRG